jgi:plastocyanin
MNTEFRNRAFLPVVMPLGILVGIALLVGSFALILLYTTREVALVLATVAAGGVLLAVALAASQDKLEPAKRAVILLAGAFPVIAGAVVAITQPVDASLLNINRQPHVVLPDINLTIAAENAQSFESDTMILPSGTEVGVVFDNNDAGTPHNWAMYQLVDGGPGEEVVMGEIITGPATDEVIFSTPEPGEYYFQCDVHPNMQGTVQLEENAEPAKS